MRRTTSAVMAALVGAGTAVVAAAPATAATPACTAVVTPTDLHGFGFTSLEFDVDSANLSGGMTTDGWLVQGLLPEVPLTANQAHYSITTDQGKDVYNDGFSYGLTIDQDGDPSTTDPITGLFYEPQKYGAGVWHSGRPGVEGIVAFAGTLAQFLSANPHAMISAFVALYGPNVPDGVEAIRTLTFQACTYTFAAQNRPPTAAFVTTKGGDSNYRTFGFDARTSSDPERQPLTYSWKFGDGTTGHGARVKHTYPTVRGKTYTATLTVSDGVSTARTTRKVVVR